MSEEHQTMKKFRKAFRAIAKTKKRGVKKKLAEHVGVSRSYISDIYGNRRPGSEHKRRAIAEFFNLGYDQFLRIGERLIEGEDLTSILQTLESTTSLVEKEDSLSVALATKWPYLTNDQQIKVIQYIEEIGSGLVKNSLELEHYKKHSKKRAEFLWAIAFEAKKLPTPDRLSKEYEDALKEYIEETLSDTDLFNLADKIASKYDKQLKQIRKD